jgi:glycosyltransferase involved in cell wall biosynthesis
MPREPISEARPVSLPKRVGKPARRIWERLRPYGRWLYYGAFPGRRPDYFRSAWSVPHNRVGRDSLPRCSGRIPDHRTFFFFPLADWHARMQRSQQLAKALADLGHFCIYINPHLGLEYPSPPIASTEPRISVLHPGIFELHIRLPAEHAIDSRCLQMPEAARVLTAVRAVVNELEICNAIQIVSLPVWFDVVRTLRDQYGFPFVYDCHDYLPGFERLAREIVEAEPALINHCDQIVFSAQYLMEIHVARAPSIKSKALLLRNANHPEDFVLSADKQAPQARAHVGYVGSLDHWFDLELLANTAAKRPDFDFVLAGRVEDNRIRYLARFPNVRFTGEIPYAAVPKLLHKCDAAIIPFRRTPLTLATNPIKLYEYLSAGLPIVSTRLPEVELYSRLLYIADTQEQFVSFLSAAVCERNSRIREQRIAAGRAESWRSRAHMLLNRVERLGPMAGNRTVHREPEAHPVS